MKAHPSAFRGKLKVGDRIRTNAGFGTPVIKHFEGELQPATVTEILFGAGTQEGVTVRFDDEELSQRWAIGFDNNHPEAYIELIDLTVERDEGELGNLQPLDAFAIYGAAISAATGSVHSSVSMSSMSSEAFADLLSKRVMTTLEEKIDEESHWTELKS